jgi:hypothetical protein
MRVNTLFVAVLASTVSAQTPEGFEPATDNYLVASYGSSTITPGLNIPINGDSLFLCLLTHPM